MCCRRVFLYLLTFVQIGIYWVNHHYLIDEVETVSHGILWANLIFLFCLSLFPFATDWIGVKGLSQFSTALYAAVSILPGLSYIGAVDADTVAQYECLRMRRWGKQIASVVAVSAGDSGGVLPACGVAGADRHGGA